MRLPEFMMVGLAALLAGVFPGSFAEERPPVPVVPETVHAQVSRLSKGAQDCVRSDGPGRWTLPTQSITASKRPFEELDASQMYQLLEREPRLLGTASVGKPNRGSLLNAVRLPESPRWSIQSPQHVWGTPALVSCLDRSVEAVHEQFAATPPLFIGDLSRAEGGHLRGHVSHQSGLDADIGYYYVGPAVWYDKATVRNLDVPRTWALVRAMVTDCDVEYVFTDMTVQYLLREHALAQGEDPAWLDALFAKGRGKPGVIRHAWGHQTHIHVRVFDDRAQLVGERVEQARLWARRTGADRARRM